MLCTDCYIFQFVTPLKRLSGTNFSNFPAGFNPYGSIFECYLGLAFTNQNHSQVRVGYICAGEPPKEPAVYTVASAQKTFQHTPPPITPIKPQFKPY